MRHLLVVLTGVAAAFTASSSLSAWGAHGHQLAGQAAVLALPDDVPAFFRNAAEQLSWLNPEPDRWRDRAERDADPALAEAFDPDHYIDMEIVPTGALDAPHRYAYLAVVTSAGKTAAEVGTSPYRMLEVFQRLRSSFRAWRAATDPKVRGWIEDRIINDAGILGHYVTDAANPLHTTIHHHGWVGPNPKAYPPTRRFIRDSKAASSAPTSRSTTCGEPRRRRHGALMRRAPPSWSSCAPPTASSSDSTSWTSRGRSVTRQRQPSTSSSSWSGSRLGR